MVKNLPRSGEQSKQAILDATRELIAEGSVGSLTVEAVAARAGVAKTTIYRRWRDKWELALDAVMIDLLPAFYAPPADVGDTRKELIAFTDSVVKSLGSMPSGPAMQGLVSQIATDPQLLQVYRDYVVDTRRAQLKEVIDRGIARGELRADTRVDVLHEFLIGAIFYRLLLSGGRLDRKLSARLVDGVLEGFAPR